MHERRKQLIKTGQSKFSENQDSKKVIERKIKELLGRPISDGEEKLVALTYDLFLSNGASAQEFTELWDSFLTHALCCDWYIDRNQECINEMRSVFDGKFDRLESSLSDSLKSLNAKNDALSLEMEPIRKAKNGYLGIKSLIAIGVTIAGMIAALIKFVDWVPK